MTATQQETLYAAERALAPTRQFDTYDEIQEFVDALRDQEWWVREFGDVLRVEVGRANQNRTSGSVGWFDPACSAGRIEMWVGHMDLQSVLHELAHVLAAARWHSKSHDPWFARVYGQLTYHVRGSEAWLELQRTFDQHGVEYDVHVTPAVQL